MAQLFLTIGCEEIPARMQKNASRDLERAMVSALDEAGLAPQGVTSYYGPRHLAVEIAEMLDQQPDRDIEKRGPRSDAPDKAIAGFCQSVGMSRDELVEEETSKGVFLFARKSEKGQPAADLLPEMVQQILANFPWPKSQRWGTSRKSWVRPMHHIGLLLDGKVVEGAFDLGGNMSIAFSNQASGHPFHAPEIFSFSNAQDWAKQLDARYVIADVAQKTQMIKSQIAEKTAALGIEAIADDGLMAEVSGLVEWPNVIIGTIAPEFMALPAEVLITSMRVHQKYFATCFATGDKKGQIAPYFITIANRISTPETDTLIQKGNERVLRARLADAAFFYDQDRAQDLSSNLPSLDNVTFYEGLGSVGDKVKRMTVLSAAIAAHVTGADAKIAEQAAHLAKADLVTDMVGEFPELQGLMGGYYAAHHGADDKVVQAISDHYKPAGPSDRLPASPDGLVVSLADKIDTLVGFFGIGAKPTGSKDPFALRRAALAILRICDEADIALPLGQLLTLSAQSYGFDKLDDDLPDFVRDRLIVMLRDGGVPHDIVGAVLHGAAMDDPRLLMVKARQVAQALASEKGAQLRAGFKRANNILAAEAKKTKDALPTVIDETLFIEAQESNLYQAVQALPDIAVKSESDIAAMIASLGALASPINDFFDAIIVNHEKEEIRNNRLALLQLIISQMGHVGDFTKLEG